MADRVLYIGVDLGDKTTSVFYVNSGTNDTTNCVQLPGVLGNTPLESVVGVLKDGQTVLSDAIGTYEINQIDRIYNNFKRQPDVVRNNAADQYQNMHEGIRFFLNHIFNAEEFHNIMLPLLQDKDRVVFCIGYPTNWADQSVEAYKQVIADSVIGEISETGRFLGIPAEVHYERESTGAFVYLNSQNRVTKQFRLKGTGSILVLDFGSSTVNVTAMGRDSRKPLYSSGNNRFGGRQLDSLIAEYCIRSLNPKKKALFDDIDRHNNRIATNLMVLAASSLKESLSVREKASSFQPFLEAGITLDREQLREIACNTPLNRAKDIIPGVIPTDDTYTWAGELTAYLIEEKQILEEKNMLPEMVILTGGGASMQLIQEISRNVFGEVLLVDATEVSTVIARGLALAAKNQEKSKAFDADIDEYIQKKLPRKIDAELPTLVNAVASNIAEFMGNQLKVNLRSWKSGYTHTFDDVIKKTRSIRGSELAQKAGIQDTIQRWYRTHIRESVEQELNLICRKYGAVSFRLPADMYISLDSIPLPYDSIIGAVCDAIVKTVGIIIGVLTAALALSGVGLVVIAGALGVAASYLIFHGWESMRWEIISALMGYELPTFARQLISVDRINQIVDENTPEIREAAEKSILSNRVSLKQELQAEIRRQVNAKVNEIRYELMI